MKRVILFLLLLSLLTVTLLCMPVSAADGYELLENGGFEEIPGFTWTKYVACTVDWDESGASGSCIRVTGRTHYTDIVRQYITKKLSFYGHGTYLLEADVRLADPSDQPVDVQIAIGAYSVGGDKKWATSDFVTVTADGWAHIRTQVNISWSGKLEQAEFYFITRADQETTEFRDLLIDNCSMKTVSYTGEEYATEPATEAPTEKPTEPEVTTAEPVTEPAETTAQETDLTDMTEPVNTEWETAEVDTPSVSDPGSMQSKVIGGMMIAVGVILLACAVALTVTYIKGGRAS